MPKKVTITPAVREVLAQATVEGTAERPVVKLNQPGLERGLYVDTDKVLKALGGKWDRKAGGHVFNRPVEGELAEALRSGVAIDQARTAEQFFTPNDLAVRLADIVQPEGCDVLEPSAGSGQLVFAVMEHHPASITAVEIDDRLVTSLCSETEGRVNCIRADFTEWKPNPPYTPRDFDCAIMNPPFGRGADMAHVSRAFGFLRPGGILAAIMSPHWTFGDDRQSNDFRVMLSQLGDDAYDWDPLPAGSFTSAGTGVGTGILTMRKGN